MKLEELKKNFERGYLYPAEVRELFEQVDTLSAVVERQREFLAQVAKQIAEKPDYWSSCGQCERNSSDAEDLIELTPATALALHDAEVLERFATKVEKEIGPDYVVVQLRAEVVRLRAGGEG